MTSAAIHGPIRPASATARHPALLGWWKGKTDYVANPRMAFLTVERD